MTKMIKMEKMEGEEGDDKSYFVMKSKAVEIAKEVKRSDGL